MIDRRYIYLATIILVALLLHFFYQGNEEEPGNLNGAVTELLQETEIRPFDANKSGANEEDHSQPIP